MSRKVIVGVFDDYTIAGEVIEALKVSGFDPHGISILGHDCDELRAVAAHVQSKGPDKLMLAGGLIGAVGGLMVGFANISVPGTGSLLVAGPMLAALSGAAAGGMLGVITGALVHFDVPEYDAKVYEAHLTEGKVLIAVHTETSEQWYRAEGIMDRFEATEIDTKVTV